MQHDPDSFEGVCPSLAAAVTEAVLVMQLLLPYVPAAAAVARCVDCASCCSCRWRSSGTDMRWGVQERTTARLA